MKSGEFKTRRCTVKHHHLIIWKLSTAFIAGEITKLESSNGYLIYRGGLSEVEKFISKYLK